MRVNLGCGEAYLDGWLNVDVASTVKADVHSDAFDFVLTHGADITELYMGHFIEHLLPRQVGALLKLMTERLTKGTVVSAVTPDMRAVFAAYAVGEIDNERLNQEFVYSYVQPSHHLWCHDLDSLLDLFRSAGFKDVGGIDPLQWEPVFHKSGPESRWQCGVRATAPGSATGLDESVSADLTARWTLDGYELEPHAGDGVITTEELLLNRIERLRQELHRRSGFARDAQAASAQADCLRRELEAARHGLAQIQSSRGYAAVNRVRKYAEALLPRDTKRRRFIGLARATKTETQAMARRLRQLWLAESPEDADPITYEEWAAQHRVSAAALGSQQDTATKEAHPLNFLVVIFGGGEEVQATLASMASQSWPYWKATVISAGDEPRQPLNPQVTWHRVSSSDAVTMLQVANASLAPPDLETDLPRVGHRAARDFIIFLDRKSVV